MPIQKPSSLIEKYFKDPAHSQARGVYFEVGEKCACAVGALFLETHDKIPVPCDDEELDGTAWLDREEFGDPNDFDETEGLRSTAKKIFGERKWPVLPFSQLPGYKEGEGWAELDSEAMSYILGRHGGMPLDDALIHLNDHLKWTPEQIVTWLRSIGY